MTISTLLLATVQFSSLNQAAEYLGITQSAITRRLQRLEQELNVTLLERQTRPLTLTAAGHRGVRAVSEH
ncbi:LysR family transcriptional regulator [Klebsiella pneumoniae]|uniref:LysR family transcriptional regulator n=1 Tax=Klebsiella pneumoniae TaxID=573 RepID=A0A377TWU0_KLEPN|nr:LysR family transcriptional regulator [Klebsiella pneumoniae]